jgi:hypothetical protein
MNSPCDLFHARIYSEPLLISSGMRRGLSQWGQQPLRFHLHVQVRLSPMTCVNDTENMGGKAQVLGFSVSSVILIWSCVVSLLLELATSFNFWALSMYRFTLNNMSLWVVLYVDGHRQLCLSTWSRLMFDWWFFFCTPGSETKGKIRIGINGESAQSFQMV